MIPVLALIGAMALAGVAVRRHQLAQRAARRPRIQPRSTISHTVRIIR